MEAELNQPAIAAAISTAKCSASQMRTRPSLAPDPLRLDGLPEIGFSDKVIAILRKAKAQFIQHPAPALDRATDPGVQLASCETLTLVWIMSVRKTFQIVENF